MQVCVLGAGITGLATAYQLPREGHQVTVIDRGAAGDGASAANGAQLSYAYVQPLADPSVWRQLPELLLAPDSPFKLRLQWDLHQWRWGLRFLSACRAGVSRSTTVRLLQLAAESRAGYERLMASEDLDCDYSSTGKLVLHADEASFAAARRQLALQQSLGTEQRAVSAAECQAIEPALAHHRPRIAGGIYTPGESAADCHKVCRELLRLVQSRGARIMLETEVSALAAARGRVTAAITASGPVQADAFVLALGTASHSLARKLGVYLPIYPVKGYSITLQTRAQPGAAPTVSVTDASRKVVFARLGDRLRVAGMAELSGYDTTISPQRVRSLQDAAREVFPDCSDDFADCQPWAGLRPATPTGLPIVGVQPGAPANLLFNTGHGALGFTLAFGSAQRIASQLRARRGAVVSPAVAALASCSG